MLLFFHKLAIQMRKICKLMRLLNLKICCCCWLFFSLLFLRYNIKGSNLELYLWEFMLQFIVFLLFIANICSNNIIYTYKSIHLSIYKIKFNQMHKSFAIKVFPCFFLFWKIRKFMPRIFFQIGN